VRKVCAFAPSLRDCAKFARVRKVCGLRKLCANAQTLRKVCAFAQSPRFMGLALVAALQMHYWFTDHYVAILVQYLGSETIDFQ